jgi:hypothetical protein
MTKIGQDSNRSRMHLATAPRQKGYILVMSLALLPVERAFAGMVTVEFIRGEYIIAILQHDGRR